MSDSSNPRIPNAQWLLAGVGLGILMFVKLQLRSDPPMSPGMWIYLLIGLLVASAWQLFENPKPIESGYVIVLLIPITACFWPIMFLLMLINKPWDAPKWKNRHEPSADVAEDQPPQD